MSTYCLTSLPSSAVRNWPILPRPKGVQGTTDDEGRHRDLRRIKLRVRSELVHAAARRGAEDASQFARFRVRGQHGGPKRLKGIRHQKLLLGAELVPPLYR